MERNRKNGKTQMGSMNCVAVLISTMKKLPWRPKGNPNGFRTLKRILASPVFTGEVAKGISLKAVPARPR
ncbi:MAG: hypothetical protein ACYTHM_05045 [Planctomycetota bacterium]|jgi:hypothetical protein